MSEWSLLFHVHGDECVDEMGGVQSRKMRSYGFFPIIFAFFFPVLFFTSRKELQDDHRTPY
jgi:hypothetical protein